MTQPNRDTAFLHPDLLEGWKVIEEIMLRIGHPVFLTEGVRPGERQDALYAQGRTTPGPECRHTGQARPIGSCEKHPLGLTVTNAKAGQSDHQPDAEGRSKALDFAFRGRDTWAAKSPYLWTLVGCLAKALGMKWGGDWPRARRDRPHLYIALVLIATLVTGCAWSRGRVRVYEGGELTQDIHCWTIVAGKGRLGAACDKRHAELASEDTGFSDNAVKALGAIAEGAARGASPLP
jgi:peptidoglycan L-alanyl-D-glutamate endopeptidase CwlK